MIQPGDIHNIYDYDSHNNLIAVTDGNGNQTTYVFDDMGRTYQENSPDSGTITYHYDPAGNTTSMTDANGITIYYSYDALNRLILNDFPTNTDIVYSYDTCPNGKGKLCQVQDQAGTATYAYSAKGKLAQEDRLILGVNYTTGYQYDENGNLKVLTYPSGRTVTYVYDNAEQVTMVLTTPSGGAQQSVASSISYKPFGSLASLTYGNGLVRTVGYDLQYRGTSLQVGALQDLTYVTDPNGSVQDIVDNLDPSKNTSFSYDSIDRLDGATGPWGTLSWTYDDVGNRLTYTDGSGTTNYGYFTGTNRLQALTGATSKTFSYTNAGNTETEDTRQYVYNENNRLTQVSDGGVLGDYTYNGYGERVIKTVQGATTIFFYDQNGTLIGESDGVNVEEYVYLGRRPIARASGQDLLFIHTDHLGTPRMMTNVGGASVWDLEARPFGDGEVVTGTATLNLRFPGQYYDEETGTNYNYFRTYRTDLGRYLEADPIGLGGGANLYSYVSNNPVDLIDPFGLFKTVPHITWVYVRDPDMRQPCGVDAGGGCTPWYAASLSFKCIEECDQWRPQDVQIHYFVKVVVYTGDFNDLRTRPKIGGIEDAHSAAWHEFDEHVAPSIKQVAPRVREFEQGSYDTEGECLSEGAETNRYVQERFARGMRMSQRREQAGHVR